VRRIVYFQRLPFLSSHHAKTDQSRKKRFFWFLYFEPRSLNQSIIKSIQKRTVWVLLSIAQKRRRNSLFIFIRVFSYKCLSKNVLETVWKKDSRKIVESGGFVKFWQGHLKCRHQTVYVTVVRFTINLTRRLIFIRLDSLVFTRLELWTRTVYYLQTQTQTQLRSCNFESWTLKPVHNLMIFCELQHSAIKLIF